ncbi:hypothetical protein [Halosolutus gelatinilyticus]|uniref:hypothetical protein n=1 Tax=Halosolutus gelatinilyticus TaxID=2931975 RepID=UPI001FF58892|nr:hypothetical protein [Halosolutus gelatinilyticus]
MSDGRSSAGGSGESTEKGDSLEPGGGPRRVVSNKSVDDILDSLDETPSDGNEEDGSTTSAQPPSDSDDSGAEDPSDEDGPTSDSSSASSGGSAADAGGSESEPTAGVERDDPDGAPAGDGPESDAGGARSTASESTSSAASIDDQAAALNETNSTAETQNLDDEEAAAADEAETTIDDDALAARIDRGAVTGADVRAAETGEGREETPEVDEIDLSIDDLEATQSMAGSAPTSTGADIGDDAGPLAGSIDDAGPLAGSIDADATGSADEADAGGSTGLLDRLKGLFSR